MELSGQRIVCASQELLGVEVTEGQAELLAQYGKLLLKWNGVYNLTRIVDEKDILEKHLLDAVAAIVRMRIESEARVLDVGSGSGVPGIVAAVLRSDWRLVLVDSVGKKTHFLKQVALELGLSNVQVVHARIEQCKEDSFDAVLSRAFSTLDKMVSLTQAVLAPQGRWYALKAKGVQDEIAALPIGIRVVSSESLRVPPSLGERHLVVLEREICN